MGDKNVSSGRDRISDTSSELSVHAERLADAGAWELDVETDTIRWTDGARYLHEVSEEYELTTEEGLEFYHPDDRAKLRQAVDRCREKQIPYNIEARLITAEGRTRWVQTTGEYVATDEAALLRGAIKDVTEQKQCEQQLMVLNRILRHNVRNGLTAIKGYSELLEEDLTALSSSSVDSDAVPELTDSLSQLIDQTEAQRADIDRLTDLLDQLSDFQSEQVQESLATIQQSAQDIIDIAEKAREIERRYEEPDVPKDLESRPILERLKTTYQNEYPEAEIALVGPNATVLGVESAVTQAIEELLENACKHTDAEPARITLRTDRPDAERAMISVEDNGPGIPKMERQVLKQESETPVAHATGIGLWFVNWLITRQGGEIDITDNEPRGSVVEVFLPTPEQSGVDSTAS